MKNDNKDIVPLIVNGEINDGRNKKVKKQNNEKLPTKRFTIGDLFLTLIGLLLVGYGVYNVINDDKKDNEEVEEKEEVKEEKFDIEELKNYIPSRIDEVYNLYTVEDLNSMKNELPVANLSNNAILSLASRLCESHGVSNEKYYLDTDMENAIKKLFGDISYTKSKFSYGNYSYTYNQETKRYYLLDNSSKLNQDTKIVKYTDLINNNDTVLVRNYILYKVGQNTKMIDGTISDNTIDESNIKDNLSNIKYYEYKFEKKDDKYILVSISIK